MEKIIVQLIVALAQVLPGAIEAIRASQGLSEEEKKEALDKLSSELEAMKAAVAAVKFKDV